MGQEYKMNADSFLTIKRKVKEEPFIDEDGNQRIKVTFVEEVPNAEVNLGSIEKPNKEILSFKYKEKIKMNNLFGGLFE